MSGLNLGATIKGKNYLKRMTTAELHNMLNLSMVAGGLLIANEWKETIKREDIIDTGSYLSSVHVAGNPKLTPDFKGNVIPASPNPLIVEVGTQITDPPYPVYLEFGTSRMNPHPSAGPAFDRSVDKALKEVGAAFGDLLAKAVKRGGG